MYFTHPASAFRISADLRNYGDGFLELGDATDPHRFAD
jgi:hypothetical protein